jgi:hypothetical protein
MPRRLIAFELATLIGTMKTRISRLGILPAALAAVALLVLAPPPAHAGFWYGFKRYWTDYFGQQNGVVMTALVIGALSIFIITRGKWKK